MNNFIVLRALVLLIGLLSLSLGALQGEELSSKAKEEFFEKSIRPLLYENCFKCHGEKVQKSGLRLDSRAALLRGGEGGKVVDLKNPDSSRLIRAVAYEGELLMPPKKRLPQEKVDLLRRWLQWGAPWPNSKKATSTETQPTNYLDWAKEVREEHWSFLPVQPVQLPSIQNPSRAFNPIDTFILDHLDRKGLQLSEVADRQTLIRRLHFALTGLPPSPESIREFIADDSPDAYSRLVERLLDSPQYGERWARHWLDVARFADTRGYVFTQERTYAYAYTYRDYVIRSFNEDLPYDRFLLEQLAADLLDLKEDNRALAALGFLTLGRRFLNNVHDIIDDRIDTVGRGLQGLTLACARCHDHKFDPISTREYYSLYGVFAGSYEPKEGELPLIGQPEENPLYPKYIEERQKILDQKENFRKGKAQAIRNHFIEYTADYLLAVARPDKIEAPQFFVRLKQKDYRRRTLSRWQAYSKSLSQRNVPALLPWFAFSRLKAGKDFPTEAKKIIEGLGKNEFQAVPPKVTEAFKKNSPKSLKEVAKIYDQLFSEARKSKDPSELEKVFLAILKGPATPASFSPAQVDQVFNRQDRQGLRNIDKKLDRLSVRHAGAPARAMVLREHQNAFQPVVFKRGNPRNRGERVNLQYLAVVQRPQPEPFKTGGGRLELAETIASEKNPLTARVWVNRVWQQHFGHGLVRTPGDFGLTGEVPSHPRLLDYLAHYLIENDWSTKALQRLILSSRVYRQKVLFNQKAALKDPDNRLLWSQNRRRLEFEPLRDSMLYHSGSLEVTQGGRSVNILSKPFSRRRSLYGFVDRQNLPGLFRTFDLASPDTSTVKRHETTVPQQYLFLLNGPFVNRVAQRWAQKLSKSFEGHLKNGFKPLIESLAWEAWGRAPSKLELEASLKYLGASKELETQKLEELCQAYILSSEYSFVD